MKYDPLHTFISPVTGKLSDTSNLPNLTDGKIWEGDSNNNAVEVTGIVDIDAPTFVLNTSSGSLPNAQALDDLTPGGIAKVNAVGIIEIATPGVDYAILDGLLALLSDAADARGSAQLAAASAAASAATAAIRASSAAGHAVSAAASAAIVVPFATAAVASAAAAAASAAAAEGSRSNASDSADDAAAFAATAAISETNAANSESSADFSASSAAAKFGIASDELDTFQTTNFTLVGDVTGADLVSNSISITNADNAVFTGTGGIVLPGGTTVQRDAIVSPVFSMMRFNTTLSVLEFYNGTAWVSL